MSQALGTDGAIEFDLALNRFARSVDIAVLNEVDDGLDGHGRLSANGGALGHHALGASRALPRRLAAHWDAVQRMACHIGVMVDNLDDGNMAPVRCSHLDIQIGNALDQRNIAVRGVDQQFIRTGTRNVIYAFQHLEGALCVTAHGAQDGRRLDTAHPARVGYRHALHVFDDIARASNVHVLGLAT